ncbi:hypothetical protein GOODEAATRI_009309 [Goodea atripinnis]|uniref:Uncharacterized protein n=1 Tax=Goodea atripinnis TaxID=208336 RepID=A0ABV0MGC6_9TELE
MRSVGKTEVKQAPLGESEWREKVSLYVGGFIVVSVPVTVTLRIKHCYIKSSTLIYDCNMCYKSLLLSLLKHNNKLKSSGSEHKGHDRKSFDIYCTVIHTSQLFEIFSQLSKV